MLNRLIHRTSAPIGLDIGASGVRLLQLKATGSGIEATSAARFERKAEDDPENPFPQRLIDNVKRRLDTGEFNGRQCIMTFPDHWLSTRSVRLPVMPREESDAALKLEAAERLGYNDEVPGEVAWVRAGKVRQGDEWREEIILAGVDRGPLTRLVDAVSEAGLHPVAVEPSFIALGRVFSRRFRREGDRQSVRIGLDMGQRNTSVFVLRGPDVAFYKPLRLSGADFTQAVAERLDLPLDAAADLRRQRQRAARGAFEPSVDRTVYEASRPLIEELAKEAALCLRYFTVAFTGDRPCQVFTCGDEAAEPRLAEALGSALRLEHRVGDPFEGVHINDRARLGSWSGAHAAWSSAVGLSLRGLPAAKRRRGSNEQPILDGPTRSLPEEQIRKAA